MGFQDIVTEDELRGKSSEEAGRIVNERAWEVYDRKVEPVRGSIMRWEREMSLKMIDRAWVDHIDTMSKLRDGIGLRSYAQSNPLQAYVTEGYELFENMMSSIAESIVSYCMRLKVVVKQADGTETTRDNASTAAAEKKTEAEQ